MATKKVRKAVNRRDRRKAKQSKWRRSGTANPKKVGHHVTDERAFGPTVGKVAKKTKAKKKPAATAASKKSGAAKKIKVFEADCKKFLAEPTAVTGELK